MKKRNHIWLAAIFVFLFILLLGWLELNWVVFTWSSVSAIVIITLLYSLLPDIDHKNSTITWLFFGVGVLGLVFGVLEIVFHWNFVSSLKLLIISAILLVGTFVSANVFGHRGFTHSIPAGILAVLPLLLIGNPAYCLIGYVAWHSHLIGDGYLLKIK